MAEVHLRLLLGVEWMDSTLRVIDSVGLGSHLAAYGAGLFLLFIMFTVWRMTRAPLSR